METTPTPPEAQAPSWRDCFPVHPAADMLPMMSDAELDEMGEDIRKHGLRTTLFMIEENSKVYLLDGRNRLDAMERAGILKVSEQDCPLISIGPRGGLEAVAYYIFNSDGKQRCDPYKLAISVNIRRRHLSAEDRISLAEKLLKARPQLSNRQVAEQVKLSPTTVGKVRDAAEAAGDVSTVDTRTDTKGRQQPAHKPPKAEPDAASAATPKAEPAISPPKPEPAAKRTIAELTASANRNVRLAKDAFEREKTLDELTVDIKSNLKGVADEAAKANKLAIELIGLV